MTNRKRKERMAKWYELKERLARYRLEEVRRNKRAEEERLAHLMDELDRRRDELAVAVQSGGRATWMRRRETWESAQKEVERQTGIVRIYEEREEEASLERIEEEKSKRLVENLVDRLRAEEHRVYETNEQRMQDQSAVTRKHMQSRETEAEKE